jgi:hypothetical protein
MSWAILALLVVASAGLMVCAFKIGGSTYGGLFWDAPRMVFFWTGVIVGVAAAVFGGVIIGRDVDHHFQEQGCRNYGEQTSREVRWVDVHYFDYGCYVEWNDTWIPRDDYVRLTFGNETGVLPD